MAATKRRAHSSSERPTNTLGTVMLASMALPGVLPTAVRAEEPPERSVVAVKWLSYQDWQPNLDRITVSSPSIYFQVPFKTHWSLESSAVYDSLSGATPRYHSSVSGATTTVGMSDERTARDIKVTRYFDRSAFGIGVSRSTENDYDSRSVSIDGRFSTQNNNTTFNIGLGASDDVVGSSNNPTLRESRKTVELTFGITRALTKHDLLQIGLTRSNGSGYYNDPYKVPDTRPDERLQSIALARWNHYFESPDAVARSSYRYYDDSFGISAHTVEFEWVQKAGTTWTFSPHARFYTQRAADFYYDPVYDPALGAPYPPGYLTNPPRYLSGDQRLSAFGAVTLGLKIEATLSESWSLDLKYDEYRQKGDWRIGGDGSPGLDPFNARIVELGFKRSM